MNIRKVSFIILALALFCSAKAQDTVYWNHDFTVTASTGQTLYCYIDQTNTHVAIMPPIWKLVSDGGTGYYFNIDWMSWGTYTKPSGYLELPSSVTHGGTTYPVAVYILNDCDNLTGLVVPNIPDFDFFGSGQYGSFL